MYNDCLNKDIDKIFNTIFLYHIRGIANSVGIEYIEKQFSTKQQIKKILPTFFISRESL
jgi:hypothetical protein